MNDPREIRECFLTQTAQSASARTFFVPEGSSICFPKDGQSSINETQCDLSSFTCFHHTGGEGNPTFIRDLDSHPDDVPSSSSVHFDYCMQLCCENPTCLGFEYVEKWEGKIPEDLLIPITALCGFILVFVITVMAASRAWKRYRVCYLLYLVPLTVGLFYGLVLIPEFNEGHTSRNSSSSSGHGREREFHIEEFLPTIIGSVLGLVFGIALARLLNRCFPERRKVPDPEPGLVPYDRLDITATPPATGLQSLDTSRQSRTSRQSGKRDQDPILAILGLIVAYFFSNPQDAANNLLDENQKTSTPPDFTNKWRIKGTSGWVEITLKDGWRPMTLDKYALRSANDDPCADPSAWRVFGIDAHGERHLLHTQAQGNHWGNDNVTDDGDGERWAWRTFSCDTAEGGAGTAAVREDTDGGGAHQLFGKTDLPNVGMSFEHSLPRSFGKFRIEIDSNCGSSHTQLGQVKLYEKDEYM